MILTYFKLQPHQLNIAVLHLPHTREILPSFLFYPTETHTGERICPSSYSYWVVAWHHPAPSSAARLQITPPLQSRSLSYWTQTTLCNAHTPLWSRKKIIPSSKCIKVFGSRTHQQNQSPTHQNLKLTTCCNLDAFELIV